MNQQKNNQKAEADSKLDEKVLVNNFQNMNKLISIVKDQADEIKDTKGNTYAVKHHQLRNLLDLVIKVKSVQDTDTNKLNNKKLAMLCMLRPKIAYMAARQKNLKNIFLLYENLLTSKFFTEVNKNDKDSSDVLNDNIDTLYNISEALVAFHKKFSVKED